MVTWPEERYSSRLPLDYLTGTLPGEDRKLYSPSSIALSSLYRHHDGKFVAILYWLAWIGIVIV